MPPTLLLTIYCVLILLASLAGGMIPLWIKLTHQRMELAVSAVAGFMLGVGLLHLFPHALEEVRRVEPVVTAVLVGFLAMFFIERFFCFHHHDVPAPDGQATHSCNHDSHDKDTDPVHGHELSWSGAAVGLVLHSVIAGAGLAASIANESQDGHGPMAGVAVFLMIFLHKPFDSMSLTTLMGAEGWSMRWRHLVNGAFALAVPVGAGLYILGAQALSHHHTIGYALAFAAGVFLCISMSDLLPELQFHQHDRFKLSAMLLLGLALAWTISWFEARSHDHDQPPTLPPTHVDQPSHHDTHDHHHSH